MSSPLPSLGTARDVDGGSSTRSADIVRGELGGGDGERQSAAAADTPSTTSFAPPPSFPYDRRDSVRDSQDPFSSAAAVPVDDPFAVGNVQPSHPVPSAEDIPLPTATPGKRRRRWILAAAVLAFVVVVVAVVVPVVLTVGKNHSAAASSGGGAGSGSGSGSTPESPAGLTTGGNGTVVRTAQNTTFTYINEFGGYWIDDPADPYNAGARAQSFTPALNESWNYGTDQVRGVNLGGWLVLEPYIAPALFEPYQNVTPNATLGIPTGQAVDEWSLSVAIMNATGSLQQIIDHYDSFITEEDFAQIAGAGLNWIRLPVPYWALDVWPDEPFLPKVAWTYVLRALQWARKYGLRVYIELHTAPGSQNGYNHSGRLGTINFLNGPMGVANAQRMMEYDRILAEFISQDAWTDVVQMFGIINEPLLGIIGRDQLERYYLQSHNMLREITGIGNGAYMVIHDGFQGLGGWKDFLPGSDRIILDTHPYFAFGGDLEHPLDYWPATACRAFQTNQSLFDFGITVTGEFSTAINDCGKWVKGVGVDPTFSNCTPWDDWPSWTQDTKDGLMQFILASMDAMHTGGYFFWTWKVGNSSVTGKVEAPLWSYQLGLQNGWMPADPRAAVGICNGTLGVEDTVPFNGTYQPWQTGGAGAGTIAATAVASLSQYPPPALSNADGADPLLLPHYTATSAVPTLPTPTFFTAATTGGGDGWADAADTASAYAPVGGCSYPDAWGAGATQTAFLCDGVEAPAWTPPPYSGV